MIGLDIERAVARPKFPRQINLRVTNELMAALDAESERRSIPRNQVITEACERLLAGPVAAPAVVGGTSVDQGARDALTALLARVQKAEQEIAMLTNKLQQIEERPEPEPEPVDDGFADQFLRS